MDCTNKNKSSMKVYVSLYDYHLKSFFSNQKVRKDLKEKGFINSKGELSNIIEIPPPKNVIYKSIFQIVKKLEIYIS